MIPMNSNTPIELEHGPALVRAFRSLSMEDVDKVARVVHKAGSHWSLESFDDYDGYRLILVEPVVSSGAERPSYLISGKVGEIYLGLLQDENSIPIGRFADMGALVDVLAGRLDVVVTL